MNNKFKQEDAKLTSEYGEIHKPNSKEKIRRGLTRAAALLLTSVLISSSSACSNEKSGGFVQPQNHPNEFYSKDNYVISEKFRTIETKSADGLGFVINEGADLRTAPKIGNRTNEAVTGFFKVNQPIAVNGVEEYLYSDSGINGGDDLIGLKLSDFPEEVRNEILSEAYKNAKNYLDETGVIWINDREVDEIRIQEADEAK